MRGGSLLLVVVLVLVPFAASAADETNPHWTTYLTTFANVVVAASVLFLWLQAKTLATQTRALATQIEQAKNEMRADHERSRKELALAVMREWNRDIKPDTAAAEKLVRGLSHQACKDIIDNKTVRISPDQRDLVEACLGSSMSTEKVKADAGYLRLEGEAIGRLRYLTIDYLNTLETALMSWRLGVADRETVENEFEFLYHPSDNENALQTFRTALGAKAAYPAIESFIDTMRRKKDRTPSAPASPLGH